jgi:hypothetical protein
MSQSITEIYPNSVPEFRILRSPNQPDVLQVRYINQVVKYTGQWQNVPVVDQTTQININQGYT